MSWLISFPVNPKGRRLCQDPFRLPDGSHQFLTLHRLKCNDAYEVFGYFLRISLSREVGGQRGGDEFVLRPSRITGCEVAHGSFRQPVGRGDALNDGRGLRKIESGAIV